MSTTSGFMFTIQLWSALASIGMSHRGEKMNIEAEATVGTCFSLENVD